MLQLLLLHTNKTNFIKNCVIPFLIFSNNAMIPKLLRMAASLLNPDFHKGPSVKFSEVHFAK